MQVSQLNKLFFWTCYVWKVYDYHRLSYYSKMDISKCFSKVMLKTYLMNWNEYLWGFKKALIYCKFITLWMAILFVDAQPSQEVLCGCKSITRSVLQFRLFSMCGVLFYPRTNYAIIILSWHVHVNNNSNFCQCILQAIWLIR